MRYLIPLFALLLTACGDDSNGLGIPDPAPTDTLCLVCDVRLISCGGYIAEAAYIVECEGDGCICEAAPCRDTRLPIARAGEMICAQIPRP